MIKVTNTKAAEIEIVEVLHKNKIPLVLVPRVLKNVKKLIKGYTIPYSPGLESLNAGVVQKQGQSAVLSFDNMPKHSHSFKTNWKPNPNDYLVTDKDPVSSNTVKDPANNNS